MYIKKNIYENIYFLYTCNIVLCSKEHYSLATNNGVKPGNFIFGLFFDESSTLGTLNINKTFLSK